MKYAILVNDHDTYKADYYEGFFGKCIRCGGEPKKFDSTDEAVEEIKGLQRIGYPATLFTIEPVS